MAFTALEAGWYGAALLIVTSLGLVNLYLPFGVDTSVHNLAAKSIDQGGTLYVDFWDNKPPGLYYFHYVAGRLFGFDELGVHLFELLWLLLLSVCLMVTLRSIYRIRWLAALVPISSVGIYYAAVTENELTQLEFLVSLPIYLSVWCAYSACRQKQWYFLLYFLSGLFAATALLFKLALAPALVAVWMVLAGTQLYHKRLTFSALLLKMVLPVAIGLAIPLATTALWFAQKDALSELLWAIFVYPVHAVAIAPVASKTRWITATAFFISSFSPWLLFAGIAIFEWFKGKKDTFISLVLAWLAAAVGLFVLQRFSWWAYHSLLFFLPMGILAVAGIDKTVSYFKQWHPLGNKEKMILSSLIAAPLCASLAGPFLSKAKPLLSYTVVNHQGIHQYRRDSSVSKEYKFLSDSSGFLLQAEATPGPIYAFGHASVYTMSSRVPAHKIPGVGWEFYLPDQLGDILHTLEQKQVPYIFVDREGYTRIPFKRPEIMKFLIAQYAVLRKHEDGVWYVRQGLEH